MSAAQRVLSRFAPGAIAAKGGVGAVGLELGASSLRLCQLRPHAGHYEVLAAVLVPFEGPRDELINDPARFRRLLRQGMKRSGFVGRAVVSMMPPEMVRFLPINYQVVGKDRDQAVAKALAGRVDGDLDQYVIDYLPVRQEYDSDQHLALAAMARREDVFRYLDLLTHAGLKPQALDIGPAAIKRLLSLLYRGDGSDAETVLVLNTGETSSYVSVISGRRLLFDQMVEFGSSRLIQDVAEALDMDIADVMRLLDTHGLVAEAADEDAREVTDTLREILQHALTSLVEEIQRTLVFTATETRGRPVARVCVFGQLANLKGFDRLLGNMLDVPLREDAPRLEDFFTGANGGVSHSLDLSNMAVTAGLALRGIEPE